NGVADDTAAIQAALDAAFGTAASPHGDSPELNRPVYIPAGQYKITAPLLVTRVKSGHIFGDGMRASRLIWAGAYNGNSVANADHSVTPLFMTNGWAYSIFERIQISMGDNHSAGIYLFGNYSTSPNSFYDVFIDGPTAGILVGVSSPNNV